MSKPLVTISLSAEVLRAIDDARGLAKRSTYIEAALRKSLKVKEVAA